MLWHAPVQSTNKARSPSGCCRDYRTQCGCFRPILQAPTSNAARTVASSALHPRLWWPALPRKSTVFWSHTNRQFFPTVSLDFKAFFHWAKSNIDMVFAKTSWSACFFSVSMWNTWGLRFNWTQIEVLWSGLLQNQYFPTVQSASSAFTGWLLERLRITCHSYCIYYMQFAIKRQSINWMSVCYGSSRVCLPLKCL